MVTYGAIHCRTWAYGDMCRLMSMSVCAECVDLRRHMQCERGLRTINDGTTSIQMTVLKIIIGVLHR